MFNISKEGLEIIREFEGFRNTLYTCSADVYTIGYGHAVVNSETSRHLKSTNPGDEEIALAMFPGEISREEAEELLLVDVKPTVMSMSRLIKVPLNQNQIDALVSFTYNVGIGNLKRSTLLKKLNRSDYIGTSDQLPKWRKAKGKILNGLVARRAAEKELFLTPCKPSFQTGCYYGRADYLIYILQIIGDIVYTVRYSPHHRAFSLEALTTEHYAHLDLIRTEDNWMDGIKPTDLL